MKKKILIITFIASSMISFFMIGCGANATKPEDLKFELYDDGMGTDRSSTIVWDKDGPITVDIFGYIGDYDNKIPIIVTDATVYQRQTDGSYKDVTASKEIADGYLYSITPSVTGDVIVFFTYRKPNIPARETTISGYEIIEAYGDINKTYNGTPITINEFDLNLYGRDFLNFTKIEYIQINGQSYTYNSATPADKQFTTEPKLNAQDGADRGSFMNDNVSSFTLTLNGAQNYDRVAVAVYYNYLKSGDITIKIPDLSPNKEGEYNGDSVVVEDPSFKKGQLYYYVYYDGSTLIGGGEGRVSEIGQIKLSTISPNSYGKYKFWVF